MMKPETLLQLQEDLKAITAKYGIVNVGFAGTRGGLFVAVTLFDTGNSYAAMEVISNCQRIEPIAF